MATKTKSLITGDYDGKDPNKCLDLSGFDYKDLTGEKFEDYCNFLDSLVPELGLQQGQQFDFELHNATPVFKDRYPGLPNTPRDFVGVELKVDPIKNTSLIHVTRISVKMAKIMNEQITSEHSRVYGRYYLLMKPENARK